MTPNVILCLRKFHYDKCTMHQVSYYLCNYVPQYITEISMKINMIHSAFRYSIILQIIKQCELKEIKKIHLTRVVFLLYLFQHPHVDCMKNYGSKQGIKNTTKQPKLGKKTFLQSNCMHCKEDPIYVFPEIKLLGLVTNFRIHASEICTDI